MTAIPEGSFTAVKMPLAEDRVNDGYFVDTPQYMTVYSKSKNVEEAVKFLNYFYNDPVAQVILRDVRSVPPTAAAREVCAELGILDPVIMQAVSYAESMNGTTDKGLSTSPEVIQIQQDAIESIAYGTARDVHVRQAEGNPENEGTGRERVDFRRCQYVCPEGGAVQWQDRHGTGGRRPLHRSG